jgi:hypothetical protein
MSFHCMCICNFMLVIKKNKIKFTIKLPKLFTVDYFTYLSVVNPANNTVCKVNPTTLYISCPFAALDNLNPNG